MGKTIKVRCNGPGRHENEIDLEKVLRPTIVTKGMPAKGRRDVPERLVLACRFCTAGKVIVTREMIEENLQGL
jgi:hypothetical protein